MRIEPMRLDQCGSGRNMPHAGSTEHLHDGPPNLVGANRAHPRALESCDYLLMGAQVRVKHEKEIDVHHLCSYLLKYLPEARRLGRDVDEVVPATFRTQSPRLALDEECLLPRAREYVEVAAHPENVRRSLVPHLRVNLVVEVVPREVVIDDLEGVGG